MLANFIKEKKTGMCLAVLSYNRTQEPLLLK